MLYWLLFSRRWFGAGWTPPAALSEAAARRAKAWAEGVHFYAHLAMRDMTAAPEKRLPKPSACIHHLVGMSLSEKVGMMRSTRPLYTRMPACDAAGQADVSKLT